MAVKKIAKNIKFEDALAELEAQVKLLESGDLSLEQSLDIFKYGVELSKVCMNKLDAAHKEVEQIVIDVENAKGYTLEKFRNMEE